MKNETYIEKWSYEYNWYHCEVVKWGYDSHYDWYKTIWNSYIYVRKDKIEEELWNILNLTWREWSISEKTKKRYIYNYSELDDYFDFDWWITFYEKQYWSEWVLFSIKFWNDYNHIHNTWFEDLDSIKQDLKNSIDIFIEKQKQII